MEKGSVEQSRLENRDSSFERDDELPSYQASSSNVTHAESSHAVLGPTISSPFAFPTTEAPPPDYTPSTTKQKPFAIPQQFPETTSPFIRAYSPALLNYGIPADTWYSFLSTMSAFLTASVSKRALSHAASVSSSVAKVPQQLGKDIAKNFKDKAKGIGRSAKQGNVVGVVGGLIGGTVGLTVGSAVRLTGSILSLPGTAINSSTNLQTPRERAEAYAAAANLDWFHKRGLHAQLLTTVELNRLLGVSVEQRLGGSSTATSDFSQQLAALKGLIEPLELSTGTGLEANAVSSQGKIDANEYAVDLKSREPEETSSTASLNGEASSSRTKSRNAGKDHESPHVAKQTLWLVLTKSVV